MTELNPSAAATDPTDDDVCPGCGATTGVQPTTAPSKVAAWRCTACGMQWAITVVNSHLRPSYLADLAAAADEIRRLRGTQRQICALADHACTLTDEQLRERLVVLTESCTR